MEPCTRIAEILGPPASWSHWRRNRWWVYPHYGICIECENDRISEIDLYTRDWYFPAGFDHRFRPFCATIHLPSGSTLRPVELTPGRIVDLLGPATDQDGEVDELELTYELGTVTAEFSYDGDRLDTIDVYGGSD